MIKIKEYYAPILIINPFTGGKSLVVRAIFEDEEGQTYAHIIPFERLQDFYEDNELKIPKRLPLAIKIYIEGNRIRTILVKEQQ